MLHCLEIKKINYPSIHYFFAPLPLWGPVVFCRHCQKSLTRSTTSSTVTPAARSSRRPTTHWWTWGLPPCTASSTTTTSATRASASSPGGVRTSWDPGTPHRTSPNRLCRGSEPSPGALFSSLLVYFKRCCFYSRQIPIFLSLHVHVSFMFPVILQKCDLAFLLPNWSSTAMQWTIHQKYPKTARRFDFSLSANTSLRTWVWPPPKKTWFGSACQS